MEVLLHTVMEMYYRRNMKKILLLTLILTLDLMAQDVPSGYTTNYKIRKWSQGSVPTADSLNANWDLIDTKIKLAYDSSQAKLSLWTNQTVYGTKTIGGTLSLGSAGKLTLGTTAPASNGQIGYTGAYVRYYHSSGTTDTVATLDWVRSNTSGVDTTYRTLYVNMANSLFNVSSPSDSASADNLPEYTVTSISPGVSATPIKFVYVKQSGDKELVFNFQGKSVHQSSGTSPSFICQLYSPDDGTVSVTKDFTDYTSAGAYVTTTLTEDVTGIANGTIIRLYVYLQAQLDVDGVEGGQYVKMRYPIVEVRSF